MIIGTVVTNSHLARAKVLAQSVKLHHPEAKVVVCLVERTVNPDTANFPCFDQVVLAKDTWNGNFDQVIFKYEAWEACCFAKAPLLGYIYDHYPEENHILFLDSDTEVIAPLYDLMHRFDRSSILLTPQHIYKGSEYDDFKYGVYNAGFVGVRRTPEGKKFIEWWKKRLERHSYFAEYDTLFAEQKWLNLVPSFFEEVDVIKHPGYNIAGWNFSERDIQRQSSGQYTVNEEPLYIFHYHSISGLEKNTEDPNFTANNPAMTTLIKEYVSKLNKVGWHQLSLIPWSYGFFTNGSPVHRESRLVYRNNRFLEQHYPYPFELNNDFFKKRDWLIKQDSPAEQTMRQKKRRRKRRLRRRRNVSKKNQHRKFGKVLRARLAKRIRKGKFAKRKLRSRASGKLKRSRIRSTRRNKSLVKGGRSA